MRLSRVAERWLRLRVDAAYLLLLLLLLLSVASPTQGLRLAEKKCQEYIKANTETSYGGPLTLDSTVSEFHSVNCTQSVDLIVNGEAAGRGEFPHQAVLGYLKANSTTDYHWQCGGSLISDKFVMTAAHCGTPAVVRLGAHDLWEESDIDINYDVAEFIKHPDYKVKLSYNDLALVRLTWPVEFSPAIRPACLWTTVPLNITTVLATGFGFTDFAINASSVLMKVNLDVLARSGCEQKLEFDRKFKQGIIGEQLCVGSLKGRKDTCQGDSGGPIQVVSALETCMYHVVGVTSTGGTCGVGRSESVYTQVASYIDWIERVVWEDEIKDQGEEAVKRSGGLWVFPDQLPTPTQ
ncbi:serine protease snake-like [Uranotaenia lowii]|uniref:serine protease snake-like n=1 Tax=Uranotaenia lowii TaxID=190385 RepID=UPI00247A5AC5|nr:serine protease snake-like [Uranotaenia lowii]